MYGKKATIKITVHLRNLQFRVKGDRTWLSASTGLMHVPCVLACSNDSCRLVESIQVVDSIPASPAVALPAFARVFGRLLLYITTPSFHPLCVYNLQLVAIPSVEIYDKMLRRNVSATALVSLSVVGRRACASYRREFLEGTCTVQSCLGM